MSQSPLINRRDLLNHGASSAFVDGFRVRPIEVQIETTGALGTMAVKWRLVGDENWSNAEPSDPGTTWTWDAPDPSWASVVFPAGSYTAGDTWRIAVNGTVVADGTPSAGPPTATRYDLIPLGCEAITGQVVTLAASRCVLPVLSIGEGSKDYACAMLVYALKSRDGMTPKEAGAGDDNIRQRALDGVAYFERLGRSANRPPDFVDSSTAIGDGTVGSGIPQMPVSRSSRGFEDF